MTKSKLNSLLLSFYIAFLSGTISNAQTHTAVAVPKGTIENFEFKESKIFPGTVRNVTIYIPSQIDPAIPACVYVQQDGFNPDAQFNSILDTLIHKKEIPVTVAIFVEPGFLPNENSIGRPNRCLEYDGLGDTYARFLLEEILPYVAHTYKLNLSNKGNDRSIGGCSSGAISAFNAAWERPDSFSRVYCISGSFVAFRGGHELPTLIRKTEAKSIRTFLTAGTNDMENCAGDWTLIGQEMEKSLKFSGYEYQFQLLNGDHCVGFKNLFADGMRYLWKGWPEPVNAGTSAPRVNDIILPNEPWQLVAEGFAAARGPACNAMGEIFFADTPNNKIHKIDIKNHITTFIKNGDHANGLSFGANGDLYSVSETTGKIMRYDNAGKGTLYADGIRGQYVLAKPDGGLYVSTGPAASENGKVWMVKNNNKITVDPAISFATGIAMSPDQWLLAVADKQSHWVYSYEISPDGLLRNKERFYWLHVPDAEHNSGAESMCYDREGHLYVATGMGIQICAWDGPTQVILPLPQGKVTGICIGGADFDTLFAFCQDKVYSRKIKNHTLGAFTPWTKMTRGKL
ncbi:MAG: SMP-30/gluconolactonase/LRE family protein [Cyclobacteriaceae bacterium]|nr:SMP-30/gluconolactonase/LRE family protein [Cyclobacteriaceae bacterium]